MERPTSLSSSGPSWSEVKRHNLRSTSPLISTASTLSSWIPVRRRIASSSRISGSWRSRLPSKDRYVFRISYVNTLLFSEAELSKLTFRLIQEYPFADGKVFK